VPRRFANCLVLCLALLVLAVPASAFDPGAYGLVDLDAVLDLPKPATGIDVARPAKAKLRANLASYATPCDTSMLVTAHKMLGAEQVLQQIKVTQCIQVKSRKGKTAKLFIQDQVAAYLPQEVAIGDEIDLYAVILYTSPQGVGMLVNEYEGQTGN